MKLPAVGLDNALPDCGRCNSFNFNSKLRFEAQTNLVRSRSDTLIRYGKHQQDRSRKSSTGENADIWSVPTIDFSLHRYQTKLFRIKPKSNVHKKAQTTDEKQHVKKELPEVLKKPKDKPTPFVTTFRLQSAGTARRFVAKDGMYYHGNGCYRPVGPHAFRGDDFRPQPDETLKTKQPFITVFSSDSGNLELKCKSINVLNNCEVLNRSMSMVNRERKHFIAKPFVTSMKLKPKWDQGLVLQTEPYQKGRSDDQIRMDQIVTNLPWCPRNEGITTLDRPDVNDYKTVDWLRVTRHSKEEKTALH